MEDSSNKNSLGPLFYTVSSLLFILFCLLLFWFGFWKLVLEPNEIVRDFFDLDKEKRKTNKDE